MKGLSEPDSELLEAATPQVSPDTVLLILQTIGSKRWTPGYLDFTQAFHSGDHISRSSLQNYQQKDCLEYKKNPYELLDGPLQWYAHLQRTLRELGYE